MSDRSNVLGLDARIATLGIADERPRLSAFEIRDACLELLAEVRRAFPQAPVEAEPRPQLTLVGLREYLVDLEERWLPTVGVAQMPPKLTLIRGGLR